MHDQLDLSELSDHDLLLGGRADLVAENAAAARRLERLAEFHRRRDDDPPDPGHTGQQRRLTARRATVIEASMLWGLDDPGLRKALATAISLTQRLPQVWALCRAGQLDLARAQMIARAGSEQLGEDQPELWAAYARSMAVFLHRHLSGVEDDPGAPLLVSCTRRQLGNRIAYVLRGLRPEAAEERFRRKLAARDVSVFADQDHLGDCDGIGVLTMRHRIDQLQVVAQRLDHAARTLRNAGDERTLAQLRADIALDLLTGRDEQVPTPSHLRPVVNLTVPIQTVMGIADLPGVLSGGTVVPAGLARMIAADPDATWHRMLTDSAGKVFQRSTTSYRPTKSIWQQVTSEHPTCFRPGCDHPSTRSELDHRREWPHGPTSTGNLWPACSGDHSAKHTPGFSIVDTGQGGYALQTPAGFTHPIPTPEHPVSDGFPEITEQIQYSATEIRAALDSLASKRTDPIADVVDLWTEDPAYDGTWWVVAEESGRDSVPAA